MESALNKALHKSAHTSGGCVDPDLDMQTNMYASRRGRCVDMQTGTYTYVCTRGTYVGVDMQTGMCVQEVHKCGYANRHMRMCVRGRCVYMQIDMYCKCTPDGQVLTHTTKYNKEL